MHRVIDLLKHIFFKQKTNPVTYVASILFYFNGTVKWHIWARFFPLRQFIQVFRAVFLNRPRFFP
jgi:hypothetical protein